MSDPTNDMPARMWATGSDHTGCWNVCDVQTCPGVEYVRTDQALALVAEAYKLAEQAALCAPLANGESPTILQGDEARGFAMGISAAHVAVGKLTPSDALAALEADRASVRREALREAADCVGHITQAEDRDAILALIRGDQTDER